MNRRRRLLLGAAVAAPLAGAFALKPRARSGAHDDDFRKLQAALADAGLMRPTLVIDRARLDHNLAKLKAKLPQNFAYRIVAKSLPSLPLIERVRAATGTDRLMVFHQPFINLVAERMPDARLLLGKPMPVGAAQRFFERQRSADFGPSAKIGWLVDTPLRIAEYAELARARRADGLGPLRVNFEIDVGLHRGGFRDAQSIAEALRAVQAEPSLQFSGLMGYEAHASKIPGFLGGPRGALDKAMQRYADALGAVRETLGMTFDATALTLNAGGSSTYAMYDGSEPCNELAMGSGLVMPTDFDVPSLSDHQPACFIATPVLKSLDRTEIAGIESLTGLFRAWDPNTARAFFLYGGYWLADPVSPPGLQRNTIWGHSTNQDLYNGSENVELAVGDHVFLRPQQSEFVFLQFGDIAVYDGGRIVDAWPVFKQGA
jgi:D-serine deaminase-like pyridoxal phosphate-dependent protein